MKKIISYIITFCLIAIVALMLYRNKQEIKAQIASYREDISTVFYGNLKKYIDQFSSGWISYLSPANMKENKEKCLLIKKEFEDKHDIRSGTVKVVAKRLAL